MRPLVALAVITVFTLPAVSAHSGSHGAVSDPGKMPGDILYGLELFTEDVKYFFASGAEEKVELKLKFADRRLVESAALMEAGKTNLSEETFDAYSKAVKEAESIANRSNNQDLLERVESFREERKKVIHVVKENLPGQSVAEKTEERSNKSSTGSFMATGRAIN